MYIVPTLISESVGKRAVNRAKPRVLVSYFFGADTIPLGEACAQAFENLGCEVYRFHSQTDHPFDRFFLKYVNKLLRAIGLKWVNLSQNTRFGSHNHRQCLLEQAVAGFKPDMVFVIRGNAIEGETLQRLKALHGVKKTVGWWVKDPRPGAEMIDDAKGFDHYYSIHEEGYTPETSIKNMTTLAPDEGLMAKVDLSQPRQYQHEIVFAGGWCPKREEYIRAIIDLPLEIYGGGWLKGERKHDDLLRRKVVAKGIWGDALFDLYTRSKIVFNITNWSSQGKAGLNLRVTEVPSMGAFLMTDFPQATSVYLELGKEVETFESPQEFRQKVLFYLSNDQAREAIANAGYARMHQHPTMTDKMRLVLRDIGLDSDLK